MGRPSIFDETIFAEIIERVSGGETLKAICRSDEDKFPSPATVRLWVTKDEPKGIYDRYAHARESQAEAWADDVAESSDDAMGCIIGDDKSDSARVQAVKLRVDTRKWLMAKLHPRQYGDKVQLAGANGTGPAELKISWDTTTKP